MVVETLDPTPSMDGRTRTGAARRETTRRRLLECGIAVFALRGTDGAVIDDFTRAANVSRGTFYNYFPTPQDLLAALVAELTDEVVSLIDPLLDVHQAPAERVACGCRAYVRLVTSSKAFATFVTRVGARTGAVGAVTQHCLSRDMALAREQGGFVFDDPISARDLLHGAVLQSIESVHTGEGHLLTADRTLAMALTGLGLSREAAARACALPLPSVQPAAGSILERTVHL